MTEISFIHELLPRITTTHVKLHGDSERKTINTPNELRFRMDPTCSIDEDKQEALSRPDWPHSIDPWWKPIDRFEKPPYSYATLIAHALLSSKDGRLTLSDIYKWISETYPYYQLGEKSWQNSIRHNLSVYKDWFRRVDRHPTRSHPGKGGYWQVEMHMEKMFIDNLNQMSGHARILMSNTKTNSTTENVFNLRDKNILVMRPEDFKKQVKKKETSTVTTRIRFKKPYNSPVRPLDKKRKKQNPQDTTKPSSKTVPQQDNNSSFLSDSTTIDNESYFMYDENMLFNDFTYLLDNNDTTLPEQNSSVTKVIDLQSDFMEKNLHFSTTNFSISEFTDPSSKYFIPDFETYQVNQYVDPALITIEQDTVNEYCWFDNTMNINII